jgi:hypothetical protein
MSSLASKSGVNDAAIKALADKFKPKSTWAVIADEGGRTIYKAALSGVMGGAASYYLDRQGLASVFGLDAREFLIDGLLLSAESVISDIVGAYAFPKIVEKTVGSPALAKMLAWSVPAAATGAAHYGLKAYVVNGSEPEIGKEILLGAGVKLVADQIVDTWKPSEQTRYLELMSAFKA